MIIAVGKKHDPALEETILTYTKRLTHYASIEWKLIEAKLSSSMNEPVIRETESKLIQSHIPNQCTVILLDETGTEHQSTTFADKLSGYMTQSTKQLVFVIGGAYGVNQELKRRADFIWSLSKLVFPHQLVRLILVEQLYRAHTILAGEKYHHQ